MRSHLLSRTELGLPDLELWDPENGYFILDGTFGAGAQTKRRETVTSPWVHGRFATAIVKDVQVATVGIQVLSPTEAGLVTRVNTLLQALDQFSFTLTNTMHGLGVFAWVCESADYAVGPGGQVDDFDLTVAPYGQVVTATIPHSPVPVVGRI